MDAAIEFREHCKEVSKDELDMIIKAELFAHRRSGSVTEAKKHKIEERERPYQPKFNSCIHVSDLATGFTIKLFAPARVIFNPRRNVLSVRHPNLVSSLIKGILEILNLTPRCIPMDILAWTDCVRSSAGIRFHK
jgi:hypothetical protein